MVRFPEERKNSAFNSVSVGDFNDFIDLVGLKEYKMRGGKFTFMVGSDKGFKFSKIDRVLVCHNFLNKWPNAVFRALPREKYDHCPLLLSLVDSNFGPKPFRWYNSWLEREGCENFIVDILDGGLFEGPLDVVIATKFKRVRDALKEWWVDKNDKERAEYTEMSSEIVHLELKMEEADLEEDELWVYE